MPVRLRIYELVGPKPGPHGAALLAALPPPWVPGEVVALPAPRRAREEAIRLLDTLPLPPPGWLHLGLCGVDLHVPALTYVFGVSRLEERRSLLSWYRLQPRTPGPAGPLLARRLLIEGLHEIGHAAGLVHCPVHTCAMHRALWPESIDLKQPEYCPSCHQRLEALLRSPPLDTEGSRSTP